MEIKLSLANVAEYLWISPQAIIEKEEKNN